MEGYWRADAVIAFYLDKAFPSANSKSDACGVGALAAFFGFAIYEPTGPAAPEYPFDMEHSTIKLASGCLTP